jgi:hypothetical protein
MAEGRICHSEQKRKIFFDHEQTDQGFFLQHDGIMMRDRITTSRFLSPVSDT